MGRTFVFECPKCGYLARVSGGADAGCRFAVQTILCYQCKQLHDAVTALRVQRPATSVVPLARRRLKPLTPAAAARPMLLPPAFAAVLNRLPVPLTRAAKWLRFKPACPVSRRHQVRDWNSPDRCPKCGALMEQSALPYRLWD